MRSTSRIVALIAVIVFAVPSAAAAGPCEDLADACVDGTGIAACRAFGILDTTGGSAYGASQARITMVPQGESQRSSEAGMRQVTPAGVVDAAALTSSCLAYTVPPNHTAHRACGTAAVDELLIQTFEPVPLAITARRLDIQGCAAAGAGAAPSFIGARITHLSVNGGAPADLAVQPNTSIGLGQGMRLILNEQVFIPGACPRLDGAALRLEGPGGSLVVGWVSVRACP